MPTLTARLLRLFGLLLIATAVAVALSRAPDRPVTSLVARWAPPPSQFIELGSQLVHLRDEGPRGDPLPIVLVHGTAASLHTWEGWAAQLRGRRRVISVDLPGFGLSGPRADGDYRGDTYARFVLELLDRLGVRRFAIAGNSLGGEVAWRVASLAPERVDRMVLIDASGYDLEPQRLPLGFLLARTPVLRRISEWLLPRAVVAATLREVYGDPARVTPQLVDRYFELMLREGNRRALAQRMAQLESGAHVERLRALRLPTLLLWGGRDRLLPPVHGRRFASDIAGSRLVVFDDLGHVPQEEDPRRTLDAAREFLSGAAPPPAAPG